MHIVDSELIRLSSLAFADEAQCVEDLLAQLAGYEEYKDAARLRAMKLTEASRAKTGSGIEAFLRTYGLNTHEGVAIMCLAEALLRIPDAHTANRLIEDTFHNKNWSAYVGDGESFFVNASSIGLLLTGKIVGLGLGREETAASMIGKVVGRVGEPLAREALKEAVRIVGGMFVLGETINGALQKSQPYEKQGYRFSYDILGEGSRSDAQAQAYLYAYRDAIAAIGKHRGTAGLHEAPGISVKLSALHPRYLLVHEETLVRELLPRVAEIVRLAMQAGISVSIDAEEATRFDIGLIIFRKLFELPEFRDYDGLGYVLQAYQKRAVQAVDYLAELSRAARKRMNVRLVKGAYWDAEIKAAQIAGLPGYPVFTRKEHTDVSYLACAQKILADGECFYPQFATHNALTAASILEMVKERKQPYEFQRLYGMGEALHAQLLQEAPCRIYAPIGKYKDLLAYLMRRLLENGANTSFVRQLADHDTAAEELLADPIVKTRRSCGRPHDHIPAPPHLYSDRENSRGVDLGNLHMLRQLRLGLAEFRHCFWRTAKPEDKEYDLTITEPADSNSIVGYALLATPEQAHRAVAAASSAFGSWSRTNVKSRAETIRKFAVLLEENRLEIIALLMREAGKTLSDAVAELREAVDYCRYYSAQAEKLLGEEEVLQGPTGERNSLGFAPRGVFVCISPWNFPLAIFTGQIVAALVTGNTVVAKPAECTPLIADLAVKLLHKAGAPETVLHCLPGSGATVGQALTEDPRVAGVVFTGSTETARHINRTLAAREGAIGVLIAETGGQNCMIVDSSALPEQVVDDIVTSAFGSAGQRCSALRVLYVQQEIAGDLIALIKGAMQEIKTGNPFADFSVDVGPVIDEPSRDRLRKHIEHMTIVGHPHAHSPLDSAQEKAGTYIVPHLFEITSIAELRHEVFGPVLHVIRYQADELAAVCDEINSTGFGLTCGFESRIEQNIALVRQRIRAGNLYVNRSMIGATVGVQPFGGEGKSGTGPKAGGPHYLLRFLTERTFSVNTAAIGGNLGLLSGS
ncbi:MAG TPA: bifunctional proline dehydrogenase/L-glutamate gamma-semialdehyde dehydrogenase PutA [Rickettsiales bacterium]|nr:bifunctional proline dehydrogenase/L-glutamate gamma-semialdehyde dehydrogenase PutA [Rickettsiales bacterium]